MPSCSLSKFESNLLVDVERLISSHADLNHDGGGRRGLGHVTRSGVLMLCAAWELYVEELLMESVDQLCSRTSHPDNLPKVVKKELARHVKESKNHLKPLELAGDGWRTVLGQHAISQAKGLNTPKSTKIDVLFRDLLGLEDLSGHWSLGAQAIDAFVGARGDIAHRGRDTAYVTIASLRNYRDAVKKTVVETDNAVCDHIRDATPGGSPWRRRPLA